MRALIIALLASAAAFAQVTSIPAAAGGSANIPATANILAGDGAGNAVSSGIAPSNVVQTSGTATATLSTALGIGSGAPVTGGIYNNDVNNVSNNLWAEFDCNNNGTNTTRCAYNFRKNGFMNWSLTNDPSGFFGLNQYNNTTGAFLHNVWAANSSTNIFTWNADNAWKFIFGSASSDGTSAQLQAAQGLSYNKLFSAGNCSSSASPAVCSSAANGSVTVAASATTVQVNTTAVTANSQIQLTFDSSLGTKLSVTCNTTPVQPTVSARTAGSNFTITVPSAPATNPACFSYSIIN